MCQRTVGETENANTVLCLRGIFSEGISPNGLEILLQLNPYI